VPVEGAAQPAAGADAQAGDPLAPYVPRLVVDWLADDAQRRHRTVSGTFVFADISGFTALTERLAVRGKAGAEEMADLLNAVFEQLLTAAYDYGANLIKWGGDAVLLLFDGTHHAERACAAAWNMQAVMRRTGRLATSAGVVRLGMSIGVHTGVADFLLVGTLHRELVVTGPAATTTAQMETIAQRGEVVISPAAAAVLAPRYRGAARGTAVLLAGAPPVGLTPNRTPKRSGVDIGQAVCRTLCEHLRTGHVESEHRAVTVGFVEFSGTDTVLAEEGPEALCQAVGFVIDAAQEAAQANDVTFLATDLTENGGKIILTSGVPRAAGDDETRILATVRRIVHPGGTLSLRGGITCGNVFAGDYGPFYRKTYSIAGDVVNLAARLMSKAGPGQVIAMPAVVERSRSAFETTALEPFQVKGKAKPIEALLIGDVRAAAAAPALRGLPMVGRDEQLAQLLAAAARSATGRGEVIDLVGPAGIGKTRLLEELAAQVDARTLWTDGDIYGRATPYQPMHRMLRRALALPVDVEDTVVAASISDLVHGSAPHLRKWLPLIAITAGVDVPSTPDVDRLDPEMRRRWLESVTSELLGRLLNRPVIMVLNDTHFMDEATLALVRRLAADAVERPWLLIVTRRPGTEAPVEAGAQVTTIELTPLEPAAANDLLLAATEKMGLTGHRRRELVARAGGNPLFLTRLVAAAAAGEDLDALPDSLEGMIAAQIDRLPAAQRRWLRAASVLGMVIEPAWLEAMLAGTDLESHQPSGLDEFITMHLDSRLHFAHHLVRLTAYEGLPYRRRTELHARAAQIIEAALGERRDSSAALLSQHCLNGGRYVEAWRYSRLAGDQARTQYALTEAAACYRSALSAAKHVPDVSPVQVADVYEALAEVRLDLGEMAEAEQALRQARLRAGGDAIRLARLRLRTARHREHIGKRTDALRWIARGRAILAEAADPAALSMRAELAELCSTIHHDQGSYRPAKVWAQRAVAEARAAGDTAMEARSLGVLIGQSALAGDTVDEGGAKHALELYERSGDLRGKARLLNALGVWAYFAGRWDEAVGFYGQAEQTSLQIGRDFDAAAVAANQAEVLIQQGRTEAAERALGPAIRTLVDANATTFLGFALALSGRVALNQGRFEKAMDHFAEARGISVEMEEIGEALAVDAHIAECLLRSGDPAAALSHARDAAARAAKARLSAAVGPHLHRVRGEAQIALGNHAEGAVELRAALTQARAHDTSYEIEASLRALLHLGIARSAQEAEQWDAERSQLARTLGITYTVAAVPAAEAVVT
jgi:class 3 adenylate cyclase/tetratricopeptide (TPR) repeat protein